MSNLQTLSQKVLATYQKSPNDFAQWMLKNHVPVVATKTEELAKKFDADMELAVAGAWLHDFGDAFVHRHAEDHEEISEREAVKVLQESGYSPDKITTIMKEVIEPHSCKNGIFPTTLEGKVMATADALAHLTTDFYVQFAWKHLPENLMYLEYLEWVKEKLERDFHNKIFFDEVREHVRHRYEALKEVFVK